MVRTHPSGYATAVNWLILRSNLEGRPESVKAIRGRDRSFRNEWPERSIPFCDGTESVRERSQL
ncbi:MAG: hypothetical protein KME43_14380 [Myxacorys chilensis ATA2-1-KO14]|nr:hypothetical protein [Myxacorys chilensis ATA2-1-KO14]